MKKMADEILKELFSKSLNLINDYDIKKEFNKREINFGNIMLKKDMELETLNSRKNKIQNEIDNIDEQNNIIKNKIKSILENV